tara:strand:+ start:385 stop:633 length:249 start_codon:yes stop_codon:yes gene_type:complete
MTENEMRHTMLQALEEWSGQHYADDDALAITRDNFDDTAVFLNSHKTSHGELKFYILGETRMNIVLDFGEHRAVFFHGEFID